MDLYVYNNNFEFLGIIDTYSSFIWTRNYNKSGTFELHLPLTMEHLNLLMKNNIICKKDNIEEAAYIEYRELGQNENGEEEIIIKGYFIGNWLKRRITWGKQIQNGRAETVMKNYVDLNCITPVLIDRKIPNLILSEDKGLTPIINYNSLYKTLNEEIEYISNFTGLGWKIDFKPSISQYIFNVYQGKDLSINQDINPPAIFSMEFENILKQRYVESLNNYCNVALVAGEGEDENRKTVTVGNVSGFDRFEMFVDARDINSKGENNTVIPEEQVTKMLIDRGNSKLTETTEVKTFDANVNVRSNLIYKKDFDLGDMVTITNKKWGITIDTRITTIEEVYEEKGFDIRVNFGNNIPTLLDKIKQRMR